MNRFRFVLAAAGGSAALLIAAFLFQHLGGMAPCKLCIWQRYPHVIAVGLGAMTLLLPRASLILAGAAAALTTSAIGLYHVGVEQGWWQGPSTCSAGPVGGVSTEELFNQIMTAPLVRCDEIPWSLFGLSMAGWNALISLALALLWLAALRRA